MAYRQKPQYLTSAMLEEREGSVIATFGLGDVIPGDVDFFGYGIDYYGADGNGGKRFGVRFAGDTASPLIFEWSSATQAHAGHITYLEDGLSSSTRTPASGLPRLALLTRSLIPTASTCTPRLASRS